MERNGNLPNVKSYNKMWLTIFFCCKTSYQGCILLLYNISIIVSVENEQLTQSPWTPRRTCLGKMSWTTKARFTFSSRTSFNTILTFGLLFFHACHLTLLVQYADFNAMIDFLNSILDLASLSANDKW